MSRIHNTALNYGILTVGLISSSEKKVQKCEIGTKFLMMGWDRKEHPLSSSPAVRQLFFHYSMYGPSLVHLSHIRSVHIYKTNTQS
jgi:hypothetical protein